MKNFKIPSPKNKYYILSFYLHLATISQKKYFEPLLFFILLFFIKPWSFLSYVIPTRFHYSTFNIRNAWYMLSYQTHFTLLIFHRISKHRISILNLYNSYSINIGSANILQWWNEKIIYNYYTCLTVTQVRLTYAMLEMMEGIPNIMSVSSFYL